MLSDLLQCTNEPNVSIPTLANLLIERTLNPNWVVVYKSLITIHHLMCYGNEVSSPFCTHILHFCKNTQQYFSGSHNIWHRATAIFNWQIFSTRLVFKVIDLSITSERFHSLFLSVFPFSNCVKVWKEYRES